MKEPISHDTVELLKECSSGIRMGVRSIQDVEGRIQSGDMRRQLAACREKHERLGERADQMLADCGQTPTAPDPMARGMAWLKTNVRMAAELSDKTAADLLTDGCNMGAKSLTRYLNEYGGADRQARALAHELIALEEKTAEELRAYL